VPLTIGAKHMKFSVSEINGLVRHRRSIPPHQYTDRAVHQEIVDQVLSNGTWAPTHGMTQPWRFFIFSGAGRQRLADHLGAEYRRTVPPERFMQRKYDKLVQRPLQSSVTIAIGMARDPHGKITEVDELLAVGCAVQNMALTCAAYGLGAYWSTPGVATGAGMRTFLGLGEHDRALGLFFMGYPAVEWPQGHRRPLEMVSVRHEE
jgi:nitroreductase